MLFRVIYKEDLTSVVGKEAARRWAVDVAAEPHEFAATLQRLMNDASDAGQEITRVVIEKPVCA